MDADQLKCKWIQFKGALKTRWGRFRDNHLVQSEGSYDKVCRQSPRTAWQQKDEAMKGADQQQSAPEAVGEMFH